MKVIFVISDSLNVYNHYVNTGCIIAAKRRCVEIDLTDDQIKKIGLAKIFKDLETVESVSVVLA